jgi:hypothetical protein
MVVQLPSVEGDVFATQVQQAEKLTQTIQGKNFDFSAAPTFFAKASAADVVAKELVVVHDGYRQTRIGRLVMGGVGPAFNLLGAMPARAEILATDTTILDEIQRQIGGRGLHDVPEFARLPPTQNIRFFNHNLFYQLRDLVFWNALHQSGAYPSSFQHMVRHFSAGNVLHNAVYQPSNPGTADRPAYMEAVGLTVSFPTPVVEWMEKPLFGGFARETIHVEYLLTPQPSKVSHPYLPLVGEGLVKLDHGRFYLRHFAGVSPKDGLRGPDVPAESPTDGPKP